MIWGALTSPDLERIASKAVALLPLGAVEQHGQHLPVITDTALVTEIAQRTEAALSPKVALLPTFWVGCSDHHLDFAGTMSLQSDIYVRAVENLVECILSSGFSRVVLLNGHGGNIVPLSEVIYRITLAHKGKVKAPWIAVATYWNVASRELAGQTFMETPKLTHACEYETSLMLALRLDWVKMTKARGIRVERHSEFYDPLGYVPSRVSVSETFSQMTPVGAMGKPEKATPEKGRQLYDLIVPSVIKFVDEFSSWEFRRPPKKHVRRTRSSSKIIFPAK